MNYGIKEERKRNHPSLIEVLQQHGGRAAVLLFAHVLRVTPQEKCNANEVLQRLIVLASIITRGRVNVLLEKGNGGSVRDAVRIHNVEIVVSLDLPLSERAQRYFREAQLGELGLGFAGNAVPHGLHTLAGGAGIRVELDNDLFYG